MIGFVKNVVLAFKPSSIKRGLAAARAPLDPAAMEAAVASLTPEQRAAYEANMAEVERGRAESAAAWQQTKEISDRTRVLYGPAGRYLHGSGIDDFPDPAALEAQIAELGAMDAVQQLRAQRKGEFKQGLRQSFGIQEVEQIKDPAARERVAAAARADRAAARAPYRAPDAPQVRFSRLATRGETQLDEVLDSLHASGYGTRPDLLFGVYRVPDRISGPLTPHSERGRVVEWDVVHSPEIAGSGSGERLVATQFVAEDHWVARRIGEPSVLDEDLGIAFCLEAGIGPERCAGIARFSEFRALQGDGDGDSSGDLRSLVRGVVVFHPEDERGTFERLRSESPLELPRGGADGVHVEVLNWLAIADAVHLKIHHPPSCPSPFPYLPSTPQELLLAYLEVVGVRAADCYGVQATVDHARPLIQGGFFTTNLGPRQPCADGKPRMRTHGCDRVVIAYRDTPDYVAGRERWAAYEGEVLQARLRNGVRVRPPLVSLDDDFSDIPTPVLRGAFRASALIDRFELWGRETVPPYRYCWPPVDQPA